MRRAAAKIFSTLPTIKRIVYLREASYIMSGAG